MNRIAALCAALCILLPASFAAAEMKIAVLNIQDVLTKSSAGLAAKDKIEKRMKDLKGSLDKEKDALISFQEEMKKKASVWSDDKKQEQLLEFQKKRRELEAKQDNANMEMKNMQDRHLAPIMKELESIVRDVSASKGYTLVLPSNAVLYFDNSVDITAEVTKSLNAKLK